MPAGTNAFYNSGSTPVVEFSIIEGGYTGTRNVNANPLFVNQVAASSAPIITGDYKLQKCSPALNGGRNGYIPSGITTDIIAAARINYGTVEMGAYEMQLQFAVPNASGIVYVDNTKTGNGNSWANAVTELADALVAAKYSSSIQQIWVAKGTYYPKYNASDSNSLACDNTDRHNSFVLVDGVKVYGGFAGGETDTLQSNTVANPTILSGDIGVATVVTDNCVHIIIAAGLSSAGLNGFIVTKGYAAATPAIVTANGYSLDGFTGAGLFNVESSLHIKSCDFVDNSANFRGGGIAIISSVAATTVGLKNCNFTSNKIVTDGISPATLGSGAAISVYGGGSGQTNIKSVSCVFSNNSYATNISRDFFGGAITVNGLNCSLNIDSNSFIGNSTGIVNPFAKGGALYLTGGNPLTNVVSIRNSKFKANTSLEGGGLWLNFYSGEIRNCVFEENSAILGGALYGNSCDLNVSSSIFSGNTATGGSSAIRLEFDQSLLSNCLISGNYSPNSGAAIGIASSTTEFFGTTVVANKAITNTTGVGLFVNGSTPKITNSIFWGNEGATPGISQIYISAGTINATYCSIQGGYAGTGNISTDPLFINPQLASAAPSTAGDYHLQKCSPAINVGNNALIPSGITKDLDSNNRIAYGKVDMGTYEKYLAKPDANGIVYVDSSNTAGAGDGSTWAKAVTEVADALKEAKTNTDVKEIWVAKGTYKPVYNASDTYLNSICNTTDRDAAFVLVPDVKVYGGFAGGETDTSGRNFIVNETVLNGDIGIANDTADNCYHVVISSGAVGSAILDGFSVTKGTAMHPVGSAITVNTLLVYNVRGGGLLIHTSSPLIKQCFFYNNFAWGGGAVTCENGSKTTISESSFFNNIAQSSGGAILSYDSLRVNKCVFKANYAKDFYGGAIDGLSPTGNVIISNSLFTGNKATYGGAIRLQANSQSLISNCTIAGNYAETWGGGLFSVGNKVNNSIVWNNKAGISGDGIYNSTNTVSYSIVQGGYAGTGNIDADALFVSPQLPAVAPTTLGDYHLQPCSPAINMGDNNLIVTGVTKDLDSLDRIKYTTVDMGAYEMQTIDLANTTWKGVNANWNDKINWCGGYIPYDTTNVIVPLTTNKPLIGAGFDNQVKNISFANSTSIGIAATSKFTINGTYTNLGSTITNNGDWVMAGNATSQTFPGTLATVSAMNNLEVNNSSGLKLDKSFQLTGTLTPTAGNINVDNATVTLNSDATSTARVSAVPTTVAFSYTGTGKFEIERYIPSHRAWRLLTAPLDTATNLTISQAWQEGLSNANRLSPIIGTAGFGTTITKSTTYSAGDGYDHGSTNSPSIRYYNGTNWGGFPSKTIGTTVGADDGLINDKQGYMLFVRGDRAIVVAGTGVVATVTTLRPKGQLKTGPQTIVCNGWTVIGNPYASPINFHNIVLDNPGMPDAFYVWDANLAGSSNVGGWVSYGSYDGGSQTYTVAPLLAGSTFANNKGNISSGSAFMVNYIGTITINENNKSTLGDNVLLRPVRQLSMNLYVVNADSTESLNDGLVIKIDVSPQATNAEKNKNFTENLAVAADNKLYAIQNRRRPHFNDTIFISTGQMKLKNYVLEIKVDELNVPNRTKAYLEDTYRHLYQPVALEGSTRYAFNVNADSASLSATRFRLLFKKLAKFGHINAAPKENDIEVQWQMEEIFGIQQFEIERSINGINFMLVQNQPTDINHQPLMQNQWLDIAPANGIYYYRVKATGIDGEVLYSDIAKAVMVKNNEGMYVYPNPITNNRIQLRMIKQTPGIYTATLSNNNGQKIFTQQWQHSGGFISKVFELPAVIATGMYQLEIMKLDGMKLIFKVNVQQ